jgi:hypothetical protein
MRPRALTGHRRGNYDPLVARFRLRFLLQEFDLIRGEIVIGRSPECQITIEDPLISRRHATIQVETDRCVFDDLSSRNGSRINGRAVRAVTRLQHADRIQIGAQELVFFEVTSGPRATRSTGNLRVCSRCEIPFAAGAQVCPHCAAPVTHHEEVTMSGVTAEPSRAWVLELVGEALERAITAGKVGDADRILRRAAEDYSVRSAQGAADLRVLGQISGHALRLATNGRDSAWVRWVAAAYLSADAVPGPALIPSLLTAGAVNEESRVTLINMARALSLRGLSLSPADTAVLVSIASMEPPS